MTEQRPYLRRGPSGPRATSIGALLKLGYDVPSALLNIAASDDTHIYLPKDNAGGILQVTFPDFTDGDTLEVDFRMSGVFFSEGAGQLSVTAVVSVDGGVTFYQLYPTNAQVEVNAGKFFVLESLGAVVITDPQPIVSSGVPSTVPVTAPPIVRMVYSFPDLVQCGGAPELQGEGGMVLKASQIAAGYVFQGPGGILNIT